jgi:hypothetical protein
MSSTLEHTYEAKCTFTSDLDYGAPRVKAFDPNQAAEAQQDAADLIGGGTTDGPSSLCLLPTNPLQVP